MFAKKHIPKGIVITHEQALLRLFGIDAAATASTRSTAERTLSDVKREVLLHDFQALERRKYTDADFIRSLPLNTHNLERPVMSGSSNSGNPTHSKDSSRRR